MRDALRSAVAIRRQWGIAAKRWDLGDAPGERSSHGSRPVRGSPGATCRCVPRASQLSRSSRVRPAGRCRSRGSVVVAHPHTRRAGACLLGSCHGAYVGTWSGPRRRGVDCWASSPSSQVQHQVGPGAARSRQPAPRLRPGGLGTADQHARQLARIAGFSRVGPLESTGETAQRAQPYHLPGDSQAAGRQRPAFQTERPNDPEGRSWRDAGQPARGGGP
jgi:hypothetical protein